jgi:hypothetical protein
MASSFGRESFISYRVQQAWDRIGSATDLGKTSVRSPLCSGDPGVRTPISDQLFATTFSLSAGHELLPGSGLMGEHLTFESALLLDKALERKFRITSIGKNARVCWVSVAGSRTGQSSRH